MFKSLQPLLAERSIHILLSATKDGLMNVYVSPAKKGDKEDVAFTTPFQCTASAEELEAQLPDVLTKWIASRQVVTTDLAAALAAAEEATKKAAEEAKKKAADKGKKVTPAITSKAATPAKAVTKPAASVTPSLLDGCAGGTGEDEDDEAGTGDGSAATAGEAAADVVPAAPALVEPPTADTNPATPVAATPAPVEAPAAPAVAPAPAATVAVVTASPVTEDLF